MAKFPVYSITYDSVWGYGLTDHVSGENQKRAKGLLEEKLKKEYPKFKDKLSFEVRKIERLDYKCHKEGVLSS